MGILCSNSGSADGRVAADFRGTTEITKVPDSEILAQHELESEMAKGVETGDWALPLASAGLSTDTASAVVGVVSDSESVNVGAKRALSLLHPSIIFVACSAPQRNLLTGSVIWHESLRDFTTKCSLIVSFLKCSTKYMGLLLENMDATMKKRLTFIKTGETPWYSPTGRRGGFSTTSQPWSGTPRTTTPTRPCCAPSTAPLSWVSCAAGSSGVDRRWSPSCFYLL